MSPKIPVILLMVLCSIYACTSNNSSSVLNPSVLEPIKEIASTEGFKPYEGNPVVDVGPAGSWDAGALGSMTVLIAEDVFHLYYESWGQRSEKEWDAAEYESLQIGHATSPDGIHWTKDPANPALPKGGEADFDRTGVWDPYVIYEDGLFKMWYGGGGGSQPNFGWAYATSTDGSHFEKKGLIGIGNQTGVEDCHVVHDMESGFYYMYYWYGWDEPEGLYLVTCPTETGFDFNEAVNIKIEGDDSYMKKFGHVLRDKDGWHMFYSNFVQPHCPNSITRYAFSEDGIHWEAKNKRLVRGHDSEVLKLADDLYLMFSSPQNGFDRTGTDVRLSVFQGTLKDLAAKPPFFEIAPSSPLEGKKFHITTGDDPPTTFHFKPEGEVVLSEDWNREDPYTFNAYYKHEGRQVHITGEGIDLTCTFNGETLKLDENQKEPVFAFMDTTAFRLDKYASIKPVRSEPSLRLEGWINYFFSRKDCRCLFDGEYFVSLQEAYPDSKNLMISLQGGGASWPGLDESKEAVNRDDIYVSEFTTELGFRLDQEWNQLVIPYCDGSIYMGDKAADYDEDGDVDHWHWGYRASSAGVALAVKNFPVLENVFITGCSAGGYGTIVLARLIDYHYPDANIFVLNESGPGMVHLEDIKTWNIIKQAWNLDPMLPRDCDDCDGELIDLYEDLLGRNQNLKIGFYSSYEDFVIAEEYLQMTPENFRTLLISSSGNLNKQYPDQFKRFFIKGNSHCVEDRDYQIDGTTYWGWIRGLLTDNEQWIDILE